MQSYADYRMIISLPYKIVQELNRYKRASINVIGHFETMHSTVSIIISHQKRCKPFLVNPVIEKMKERFTIMSPIELQISGFDFLNDGRYSKTIYAVIEINQRTENWFRLLIIQMGIKLEGFVPRIIIAKKLDPDQFSKLWPHFSGKEFKATFTVNSLTVLRQETFVEYDEWTVYRELFFGERLLAF